MTFSKLARTLARPAASLPIHCDSTIKTCILPSRVDKMFVSSLNSIQPASHLRLFSKNALATLYKELISRCFDYYL